MRTWRTLLVLLALLCTAAAPVKLLNYANDFDAFEEATRNLPPDARLKAFHDKFDKLLPGVYAEGGQENMDHNIASALVDFPSIREAYRASSKRFPADLDAAVTHFRQFFPDFESPYPVYLLHDMGMRDGGTATVDGKTVMLFGADMIARLHNDDSVQPFIEHELFHLEHARHFGECDIFWCQLWKEGLAVYAASVMTPGANDHQLLLDMPGPIRPAADAHFAEALCFVSANFDNDEQAQISQAFMMRRHPPELPGRFGYYVGLRLAQQLAPQHQLSDMANMDYVAARPLVRQGLMELMQQAKATCPPPPASHAVN